MFSDISLQGAEPEPEFQGAIANVTYPAGREAVLTCSVKNLGKYKVYCAYVWIYIWKHVVFPKIYKKKKYSGAGKDDFARICGH